MESTYYMENYGGYITFVFSQNAKQIGIETLVYIIPIGFIQVIFFKKSWSMWKYFNYGRVANL